MLSDVGTVFISRIGGPNRFAQGGEALEIVMIITTMQGMSHPVRRLCPPPDIALECIGQTTLGFPTSRPVKAPGSYQHGSVPLPPRRSYKYQSTIRLFETDPL
jgi:hypothetical protein